MAEQSWCLVGQMLVSGMDWDEADALLVANLLWWSAGPLLAQLLVPNALEEHLRLLAGALLV